MKRILAFITATALALALPMTALAGGLSCKGALNAALDDAGLSKKQVTAVETDREKGIVEVEFVKKANGAEYEYNFRARDGKMLEKEVDYAYKHNSSKKRIGKKAALGKISKFSGIASSVVNNARCTYKYKKHEGIYKAKFCYKGYKYEYKVLAPTGKIIEFEKELVNK